jgi:D-alanyl-D-alanine carboxypeptidase
MKHPTLALLTILLLVGNAGCRWGKQAQQQSIRIGTQTTRSTAQAKPAPFPVETANQIQQMLEGKVEAMKLPGAVLYLSTSEGDWMGVAGKADLAAQTPLKPTDRFRLGSLTEMFVAIVCLQLVEEGVLELDDSITSWLPADLSKQIPDSSKITVQQLLNHTSGLPEPEREEFWETVRANPSRQWKPQEVLAYLSDDAAEPENRPSSLFRNDFSYSHANYVLLGMIVERATGSSLPQVIRSRITDRLKLKNTFLEQRETIPGGFVQGYADWEQDGSTQSVTKPLVNPAIGLGDTGMISSAPDLVQLFRGLFLNNELLYETSIDKMLTPVDSDEGGYGLGIARLPTAWGEGWGQINQTTGFAMVALYLPVHDLMLITWTNTSDRNTEPVYEITRRSLRIILGMP